MCNFVSGYVTKDGRIFDGGGYTDSHSEIAAIHNLRDSDVAFYAQNLAKWECTPPVDTKLWSDFLEWEVRVDEEETPTWFDPEKVRAHVESLALPWFVRDARSVLLGGCWIFDGENAMVKQILRGRIVAVINGANLSRANLYGANLYDATLEGAKLSCANLEGAKLDGARIGEVVTIPKGWKRAESGIIVKDET